MNPFVLLPIVVTSLIAQQPQTILKTAQPPSTGQEQRVETPPPESRPIANPDHAALLAEPSRLVADKPVAEAAARAIASQLQNPDFLAIDESADGTIWAVSGSYKAAFAAANWRFIGRPAAGAETLQPVEFRLAGANVGGADLDLSSPERVHRERRVEYRYGSLVEAIDIAGRGVEQTFTFDRLPRRGELVIEIEATTELAGQSTARGIVFSGDFVEVTYAPAIAIDANGHRIAAPTTFANGRLTIRVPEHFIASAALPLLIDPWIDARAVATFANNDLGEPDIAWDETGQVWAVVFSYLFGANDWDCFVQRVGAGNPLTLVGGLTTIDASSMSWQRPRIANLNVYDDFMVVAQTRIGTGHWSVRGRQFANSGVVVTNQFVIADGGVDDLHPDIGGNATAPPCYFTVVWEHTNSPSDHDIHARQVDATGALRGHGPTHVQTNSLNQTWPSISKSCGGLPVSSQRFAIAYQQTSSSGVEDIYGAMLTFDGSFVPVAGNNTFPIRVSVFNDTLPSVSSPTLEDADGLRLILIAYERTNTNGGDIAATCIDQAGNFRASANISVLENDSTRLRWPQFRPSVDSDGLRFVVGYHELFNNDASVNDLDTRSTLVAWSGSSLLVEEVAPLATSQNREFNLQIASRYGGTGNYSRNFCTTHDRDTVPSGFSIDAFSYDAVPTGVFTTRSTGCGTLGIQAVGFALPGHAIQMTLTSTPFLSGFILGSAIDAPVGPCPGCTLGVDGFLSAGQTWPLVIPFSLSLIGARFSAQGFVFQPSGAPCIGQIQLSDTIDVLVQ